MFADRPGNQIRGAEHKWNGIAQLALFFFGLVNAGVILKHYDTGTWAVLVAALVGRPFGIVAALAFAPAAGLRLPRWLTWRDVVVVALATSSGFTFALFMTTVSLPVGAVQAQITLGALSTVVGAVAAGAAAWLLGAGRFAEEASHTLISGNFPDPGNFRRFSVDVCRKPGAIIGGSLGTPVARWFCGA